MSELEGLLLETINIMLLNNLNPGEVEFIGSADGNYTCTMEQFLILADKEYDAGYGGNEVVSDLVIVFKDGRWMSRGEYDGSEWWDMNSKPRSTGIKKKIKTLFTHDSENWGSSINDLNS